MQKMLQNSHNNGSFGDALHNAINNYLIIFLRRFLASLCQKHCDAFLCLNCLKLGVNLSHTSYVTFGVYVTRVFTIITPNRVEIFLKLC